MPVILWLYQGVTKGCQCSCGYRDGGANDVSDFVAIKGEGPKHRVEKRCVRVVTKRVPKIASSYSCDYQWWEPKGVEIVWASLSHRVSILRGYQGIDPKNASDSVAIKGEPCKGCQ
ncbi:hypothetical protein E2C01_027037 [Portunus trituberculatus]|uniref:Uncharacterized protein n=1 Tax=Portunus trituberculatus TaxID=210409 RepID=A0A5B7EKK9_PORTR|nr:hypothetical protein [Portunus trituberculatus]